jgi:cell division protein FtsB
VQDFNHTIRLLEDQIKDLKNIIKDMDSNHAREIAQLRQTNTAIFADLKKLVDNDAILDRNIGVISQRIGNLE